MGTRLGKRWVLSYQLHFLCWDLSNTRLFFQELTILEPPPLPSKDHSTAQQFSHGGSSAFSARILALRPCQELSSLAFFYTGKLLSELLSPILLDGYSQYHSGCYSAIRIFIVLFTYTPKVTPKLITFLRNRDNILIPGHTI